jgi:hypothetical protein
MYVKSAQKSFQHCLMKFTYQKWGGGGGGVEYKKKHLKTF